MNLSKLYLLLLPILLFSCKLDRVSHLNENKITIASDYLVPSDTVLFQSISDSLECSVEIRAINTDQLIGEIRNKRFNSGIDLIMMRSPYDVNRLKRQNIFHHLSSNELRNRWKDYDVVPLCVDPYILAPKKDSIYSLPDSLGGGYTLNLVSKENLIVYLSYEYRNSDPVVAAGIIRKQREKFKTSTGYQSQYKDALVEVSRVPEIKKDSLYRNYEWEHFSTSKKYNVYTIGLMTQAENFPHSLKFIQLLRQEEFLTPFLKAKNFRELPVNSGSLKLELEDQIQYFTQIERALR